MSKHSKHHRHRCRRGPTGRRGRDGAPGAPGANGTNGVNGAPGANGTNGTNGLNGRDGINGMGATGGLFSQFQNKTYNVDGILPYRSIIGLGQGSLTLPAVTAGDAYLFSMGGTQSSNPCTLNVELDLQSLAAPVAALIGPFEGGQATVWTMTIMFTFNSFVATGNINILCTYQQNNEPVQIVSVVYTQGAIYGQTPTVDVKIEAVPDGQIYTGTIVSTNGVLTKLY